MPPLVQNTHVLDEEIDDEDSFFDLVIKSDYNMINAVHKKPTNITPLRSSPRNLKVLFILGFKKPSKQVKTDTKALENSNSEPSYDVVTSMKPVPKYLKLIKPFYTKSFSKKAKVTPSCSPSLSTPGRLSEGSKRGSFKSVANKLVKSRSTSAVGGMPPVPELRRRDDTLLEKHDGIQGAILHCKKSYSSPSCHDQKRFSI